MAAAARARGERKRTDFECLIGNLERRPMHPTGGTVISDGKVSVDIAPFQPVFYLHPKEKYYPVAFEDYVKQARGASAARTLARTHARTHARR